MSNEAPSFIESLIMSFRVRVAQFAMRFCGCAVLYWCAPAEWEAYMSEGEPYTVLSSDEITEILNDEADWCFKNKCDGKTVDYTAGFREGLIHAVRLIKLAKRKKDGTA